MANEILATLTEILDTSTGDTGATQTFDNRGQNLNRNAQVQCEIGAGDTVVIEGKLKTALSFVTIHTFTTDDIVSIDLPTIYRARRTVDGGSADSTIDVQTFGNK